jgi:hypothetical protein
MKLLAKICVFSVMGLAMSFAQPGDSSDPTSERSVPLTFEQMLTQSKVLHEQVQQDWQHVRHLQEAARKEKDVIKLNCVNDKIVQIKPLMNIHDTARISLETSSADQDRANLFVDVTTSAESIRRLREQASECVGEQTLTTESLSGFTAPDVPDSPFDDPWQPDLEAPGYASPFN